MNEETFIVKFFGNSTKYSVEEASIKQNILGITVQIFTPSFVIGKFEKNTYYMLFMKWNMEHYISHTNSYRNQIHTMWKYQPKKECFVFVRCVSEIIFISSYDRYRSIYAGGICWERIDLGLSPSATTTSTSVYGTMAAIVSAPLRG